MGWFDTILYPIKWVVAWIMVTFHNGLVWVGDVTGLSVLSSESGLTWVLSIVGLVIVIRIILIPLFFKQIKAMRGQQMLQPDLQKLQKKYKGRTDPASRQAMQQEMMALYKEHGTNPFSSCLPMLAQMPIFFALFRVLYSIPELAAGTYEGGARLAIGPLNQALATEFNNATVFGATLSSSFLAPGDSESPLTVRILTAILIVLMCFTQFMTQRQLTMKNMPASALDNPMARQQRMLMYLLPFVFAISGVYFPIGVLIYWLTTNLWTTGQQFYTIRRMPAPGSEAEKMFKERQRQKLERKAARKGIPVEELLPPEPEPKKPAPEQRGQRVQPKRNTTRRKRPTGATAPSAGGRSPDSAHSRGDENDGTPAATSKVGSAEGSRPQRKAASEKHAEPASTSAPKKLTAQEKAKRRYEERAAKRQADRDGRK